MHPRPTNSRPAIALGASLLIVAALSACAGLPGSGKSANAKLLATGAAQPNPSTPVGGDLRFSQTSDGVRVTGTVVGLKPNAPHAFHVHEKGDCSASNGSSAGGHFNPTNQPHGAFNGKEHHVGDMPSLKADAKGVAEVDFVSREFVLDGPNSIIGRSVIVHENPDDVNSQPAGNAGARLACGVIKGNTP